MTDVSAHFKFLLAETFRDPQDAMRRLQNWDALRNVLWIALMVVTIISVLMMSLLSALRPPELTSAGIGDEMSPIALSVVFWLSLVLMSGCIFAIGRMMGGTGGFHDALLAMVWLQVVSVVLQVGQVILLLISPVLALLSGWVFIVFGMWLMVNFITVIHDFSSRMAVFMGMILSAVGLSFALRIILGILGVEIVNA